MTKTLRLQTGLSDGSNSPANIDTGTDWVPFYIEAEEKEESEKKESFSEEGDPGMTTRKM